MERFQYPGRVRYEDMTKLATAFFTNLVDQTTNYQSIGLDPKRPFGNGNVTGDILDIIEFPIPENSPLFQEVSYPEDALAYAKSLWADLIPFLQQEWEEYQAILVARAENRRNGIVTV